jgi:hypothetical protein
MMFIFAYCLTLTDTQMTPQMTKEEIRRSFEEEIIEGIISACDGGVGLDELNYLVKEYLSNTNDEPGRRRNILTLCDKLELAMIAARGL